MAVYTAEYVNDLGKLFEQVSLSIYLIESEPSSAVDFTSRTNTSRDFDANFIPQILNQLFTRYAGKSGVCSITQGTTRIRQAIVSLSDTQRLYIPCPFIGGSLEFDQFFKELNDKAEAIVVELQGETINPFYLQHYSKFS